MTLREKGRRFGRGPGPICVMPCHGANPVMTDPANLSGAKKPPFPARIVFSAACEPNLTMLVPTSLLLDLCLASPVLLAALGEQDPARIVLAVTGLATFAWFVAGMLFIMPLGRKPAGPSHIAAAECGHGA